MRIKVIKNEVEYESFLERISELMSHDNLSASREDELELLVTLVELYEEKKYPIDLPSPIDAIRFRMDQQGLKQVDLIPFIGSKSKVSEVLSGKRSLTLNMIRRLHDGLGIPAEVLLQEEGAQLTKCDFDYQKFPINEMLKRGWIKSFSGTLREAKERAEELISQFASPIGNEMFQPALCRLSNRGESKYDQYALTAWKTRVCVLAKQYKIPDYSRGTVTLGFAEELTRLSYFNEGPLLAKEFLEKNGIHLVFEKHLPGTLLDGAAMLLNDKPIIAMTIRYDRIDNFWFTLLHELAHLALHLDNDGEEVFFDNLDKEAESQVEKEADQWAQEALIASKEWHIAGLNSSSTVDEIKNFAKEIRIHPAIPAGRIRYEAKNYTIFNRLLGNGKVRELFFS